jgi:hypothetical protein
MEARYHDLKQRLERWRSDQESQISMECDNRLRDIPANSPVVHIMRNHVEDERKSRLKKLQRDYQTNKDEQDEGHARELRVHTESFIKRVDAVMERAAPQAVVRTRPFQSCLVCPRFASRSRANARDCRTAQ